FSPDSRVLAVGHVGGAISLLDPATGIEWAKLPDRHSATAMIMSFSPDQRWLITASSNETAPAQVWDLAPMRHELAKHGLRWPKEVLEFTPSEQVYGDRIEVIFADTTLFGSPAESDVEQ